jgi:hypothetical protein
VVHLSYKLYQYLDRNYSLADHQDVELLDHYY